MQTDESYYCGGINPRGFPLGFQLRQMEPAPDKGDYVTNVAGQDLGILEKT